MKVIDGLVIWQHSLLIIHTYETALRRGPALAPVGTFSPRRDLYPPLTAHPEDHLLVRPLEPPPGWRKSGTTQMPSSDNRTYVYIHSLPTLNVIPFLRTLIGCFPGHWMQ